jgi:hypothetical protein
MILGPPAERTGTPSLGMGDHNKRLSAPKYAIEACLEGFRVERSEAFVEDCKLRVLQQCAGQKYSCAHRKPYPS